MGECPLLLLDILHCYCVSLWLIGTIFPLSLPMGKIHSLILFSTTPTRDYILFLLSLFLLLPSFLLEYWDWYVLFHNFLFNSRFHSVSSCCFLVSFLSSSLQIFNASSKSLSLTSKLLKALFSWRDVPLPHFFMGLVHILLYNVTIHVSFHCHQAFLCAAMYNKLLVHKINH